MNQNGFLSLLRQYRELSERKHVSYAPTVDEIIASFKASESTNASASALKPDAIDSMASREYPDRLRSLPLSRPKE